MDKVKAIIRRKGGKEFSTMEVRELTLAPPGKGEVQVRMVSSRVNPVDMDLMKGFPGLRYKQPQIGGIDGAGEIVALGEAVWDFQIGDQVFFYRLFSDIGSWAEAVNVPAAHVAKIPGNVSLQEAGGIALPLLTAYESLRSLKAQAGETVLIHGAGGGVGYQAVQIAQRMGLKVIANAGARDVDALEEAGVTRMIDYQTEDFSELLRQDPPDYIFDVIGKATLLKSIALKPKKVVSIAFPDVNQMHKSGVHLPGILKFIMRMMGRKFVKAARKHQVELIGQVTGANGALLNEAARLAESELFRVREQRRKTLQEIAAGGLSAQDLGKTIRFHG